MSIYRRLINTFAAACSLGLTLPALANQAPARLISDPADITTDYVKGFGDVRLWIDQSAMGSDERRCIFNSLQRMEVMKNKYLDRVNAANVQFNRKDMEALLFNLTAQQPPVASDPKQVRGFEISIRCADAVRELASWKQVMAWVPTFEAMVQNMEATLGVTFRYVQITDQGGNLPTFTENHTGKTTTLIGEPGGFGAADARARASGSIDDLSLEADITIPRDGSTAFHKVFIAAQLGTQLFVRNGDTWQPYQSGAIPAAVNKVAAGSRLALAIARNLNARGLRGAAIYVGSGKDDAEMLRSGRVFPLYTIQ